MLLSWPCQLSQSYCSGSQYKYLCVLKLHCGTCNTDNRLVRRNKMPIRYRLDNSCTAADIMSSLCSFSSTDTRRPPAVYVGKTLPGSVIAVKTLGPPVTQSPSLDRRHASILIRGAKCLTTERRSFSFCLSQISCWTIYQTLTQPAPYFSHVVTGGCFVGQGVGFICNRRQILTHN